MRFFYAINTTCTTSTDENFTEETASFLIFKPVDGEYLLAVHVCKSKDCLDGIKAFTNLLWSSNITTSELLMMASLTTGLPIIS
jgi:hypothetical protein